jgi:hypothetical protein
MQMDTGDVLAKDAEGAEEGNGWFGIRLYCFGFIRIIITGKKSAKSTLYKNGSQGGNKTTSSPFLCVLRALCEIHALTLHGRGNPGHK